MEYPAVEEDAATTPLFSFRSRLLKASLGAVVALAASAPAPARACSMIAGWLRPTNYELVRGAEAIVLARSVELIPGKEEHLGVVRFAVEEVLAGDVRAGSLAAEGNLDFGGRTPENDFGTARPGAFAGACVAYDYRLDRHYLLFLMQGEHGWQVGGAAFSRVNEEVDGGGSPWVQAVRLYRKVAALGDYEKEKAALRKLRARATARTDPRRFPAALADDIDRHFRTPTGAKSAADLIALFNQAESAAVRRECLWALGNSAPPEAREFLRKLLVAGSPKDWLGPLGRYFAEVEDHTVFATLAVTYARAAPGDPERWAIAGALVNSAAPADAPRMLELLHLANDAQAATLAAWFATPGRDPRPAIADLDRRAQGRYGDRHELAHALAALGDTAVVAWAEQAWRASGDADKRRVAVGALAASPLGAADAAVREIIAAKDARALHDLIMGLVISESRFNPRRWDRVEEIVRVHGQDAGLSLELRQQLRYMQRYGNADQRGMAAHLLAMLPAEPETAAHR
ncbi:MAG TPA: hypothetical protein VHQ90_23345 [Thermoanaerobaculia bacterium]|nr:hypothetical protein [Thermoanaerobaculia bacterium]